MITCRAVSKYSNSLKNHQTGKKVMYRDRLEMVQQWQQEGGKPTKTDWFQKSGATGVFNVPATKDSWLASTVQHVLSTWTQGLHDLGDGEAGQVPEGQHVHGQPVPQGNLRPQPLS